MKKKQTQVEVDDDYWNDKKKEIKTKEMQMRTESDKSYSLIEELNAQISEMQLKRENSEKARKDIKHKIDDYKRKDHLMKEAEGKL